MEKRRLLLLHLSLLPGVGPSFIMYLLRQLGERFHDLYSFSLQDLIACNVTPSRATTVVAGLQERSLLENELALIEKHGVQLTFFDEKEYPLLLTHIHVPPVVLYWQGAPVWKEKMIAVVGSRRANYYGKSAIEYLVPQLVQQGWVIVSGGALGADTMAHEAALRAQGKTVAILGSGLLSLYPASNRKLFERIADGGGALVSPFPLMMGGLAGNFPARNRIISGMSKGCIVVQAAVRSGAHITASFALEQGREVFAIPGLFRDELSAGCHRLIQQGAKLVTCVDDIVEELEETVSVETQLAITPEQDASSCLEQKLLQLCQIPQSVDALHAITGTPIIELQKTLFTLQLWGKVVQDFSGLWQQGR